MNTQELKCFLRVAQRMNFTRAAEELYLTPPTVTHHIQKLEAELGVQLFQRDSKSVQLTLEGETFYQDAREIMMKIEAAFSHVNDVRNSKHTFLRIGCVTSQEVSALSNSLSLLRKKFPCVEPRIIIADFTQQLRMLKEDHLDLILGSKDMITGQNDFRFHALYSCRSCAIFSQDYSTIFSGNEVSLDDLSPYPLIALNPKNIPIHPNDAIEKFLTQKAQPIHIVRQEDACSVITLASSGYGIGILPGYVLSHSVQPSLHYAQIKESPCIEYGIISCAASKNPYISKFSAIASGDRGNGFFVVPDGSSTSLG